MQSSRFWSLALTDHHGWRGGYGRSFFIFDSDGESLGFDILGNGWIHNGGAAVNVWLKDSCGNGGSLLGYDPEFVGFFTWQGRHVARQENKGRAIAIIDGATLGLRRGLG